VFGFTGLCSELQVESRKANETKRNLKSYKKKTKLMRVVCPGNRFVCTLVVPLALALFLPRARCYPSCFSIFTPTQRRGALARTHTHARSETLKCCWEIRVFCAWRSRFFRLQPGFFDPSLCSPLTFCFRFDCLAISFHTYFDDFTNLRHLDISVSYIVKKLIPSAVKNTICVLVIYQKFQTVTLLSAMLSALLSAK